MVILHFQCGHPPLSWADGDGKPRCATCGETRIERVVAPPPRITGTVTLPTKEPTWRAS